jgi:SAM-dependent methyltransferase
MRRWDGVRERRRLERFWQRRAAELIDGYDHPETWPARRWMRDGIEEQLVIDALAEHNAQTVFVVGAGSGRQYAYLRDRFRLAGIELVPALVKECRNRYPEIETVCGDIAKHQPGRYDAVVSSAVLQHVPPADISAACNILSNTAEKVIVIREATLLPEPGDGAYMWAYDYERLLPDWKLDARTITDERPGVRIELMVFEGRQADN